MPPRNRPRAVRSGPSLRAPPPGVRQAGRVAGSARNRVGPPRRRRTFQRRVYVLGAAGPATGPGIGLRGAGYFPVKIHTAPASIAGGWFDESGSRGEPGNPSCSKQEGGGSACPGSSRSAGGSHPPVPPRSVPLRPARVSWLCTASSASDDRLEHMMGALVAFARGRGASARRKHPFHATGSMRRSAATCPMVRRHRRFVTRRPRCFVVIKTCSPPGVSRLDAALSSRSPRGLAQARHVDRTLQLVHGRSESLVAPLPQLRPSPVPCPRRRGAVREQRRVRSTTLRAAPPRIGPDSSVEAGGGSAPDVPRYASPAFGGRVVGRSVCSRSTSTARWRPAGCTAALQRRRPARGGDASRSPGRASAARPARGACG